MENGGICLVVEQGRPSKEVAQELGICTDTLRGWLKAAGLDAGKPADRTARTTMLGTQRNWRQKYVPCASRLQKKMRP